MKELSIVQKAKAYDEVREKIALRFGSNIVEEIFSEFEMSEDEKVRKELIDAIHGLWDNDALPMPLSVKRKDAWLAWLEKQGDTNEIISRDEFAQGVLRGAAIYLINWIDYNAAEGNMCLSNMECKDIEDSLVSGDWGKIYVYLKKKLEKQGEQKPWSEEDEVRLQACLDTLQAKTLMGKVDTVMTKWLKSLKNRVQPIHEYSDTEKQEMFIRSSLRPHFWKPSDVQMKALKYVAYHLMPDNNYREEMFSLYNDLKKLTD